MDTQENPPLVRDGRFQWSNLPIYAKWIAGALLIIGPAVGSSIGAYRVNKAETAEKVAAAEAKAQQAKNASEAGFQLTKEYVLALEHRISVLELAAKRAQPTGGRVRRPVPVATVPRPAPLPADLNKAEAQVYKTGTRGAVIIPLNPPDAGAP